MIPVTRPGRQHRPVNPDRIEFIEETPDTVLTLADGKKLLVRETAALVAERFRGLPARDPRPTRRFGGRRRFDPPADMNPERLRAPEPRLHAGRAAPREQRGLDDGRRTPSSGIIVALVSMLLTFVLKGSARAILINLPPSSSSSAAPSARSWAPSA